MCDVDVSISYCCVKSLQKFFGIFPEAFVRHLRKLRYLELKVRSSVCQPGNFHAHKSKVFERARLVELFQLLQVRGVVNGKRAVAFSSYFEASKCNWQIIITTGFKTPVRVRAELTEFSITCSQKIINIRSVNTNELNATE